jgi:multicomponent Na+:H+ antiporter subunit C
MGLVLSILIGVMYSAGIYLLLRRSIVKLILGILFLSNATNLVIFVSGRLREASPAYIEDEVALNSNLVSDPLPQALVLTAIVIGFGFTAFALALMYRFYKTTGTEDLDDIKEGH